MSPNRGGGWRSIYSVKLPNLLKGDVITARARQIFDIAGIPNAAFDSNRIVLTQGPAQGRLRPDRAQERQARAGADRGQRLQLHPRPQRLPQPLRLAQGRPGRDRANAGRQPRRPGAALRQPDLPRADQGGPDEARPGLGDDPPRRLPAGQALGRALARRQRSAKFGQRARSISSGKSSARSATSSAQPGDQLVAPAIAAARASRVDLPRSSIDGGHLVEGLEAEEAPGRRQHLQRLVAAALELQHQQLLAGEVVEHPAKLRRVEAARDRVGDVDEVDRPAARANGGSSARSRSGSARPGRAGSPAASPAAPPAAAAARPRSPACIAGSTRPRASPRDGERAAGRWSAKSAGTSPCQKRLK